MFDYSLNFEAVDRVSASVAKINSNISKLSRNANRASRGIQSSSRSYLARMASEGKKAISTLSAAFSSMDLRGVVSLNLSRARRSLSDFTTRARQSLDSISSRARGVGGSLVGSSAALLGSLAIPINTARKYELAFKDVKKSVEGTPEQLDALRKSMKSFEGATFAEVSDVVAEAGKMGLAADKVMQFSKNVLMGAKALDFDAKLAVEQVGKILELTNQLGNATDASLDIMNKAAYLEANMGGVKAAGIIDVWKRSSDEFAQLNFDNEQMSAMAAFLEQTSVSSELGSSGFKSMINKFKALDSELGFFTHIKEGGIEGLKDVISEFDKMNPQQINKFGSEALTLINKLRNAKNLDKLDFAFGMSKNSAGAVQREWAVYTGTFDHRLKAFQKNIANVSDDIGKPLLAVAIDILDAIKPITVNVGAWVKENKDLIVTIAKVTGVVGGTLLVFGAMSLAVSAVSGGLGMLAAASILVTGKFGLMAAATWLVNAALAANAIVWIVAGFVALAAAVVWVAYNWNYLTTLAGELWEKFSYFGYISTIFSGLGAAITFITSPMRELIGYLSEAVLGVDYVAKAMNGISGFIFGDSEKKSWANVGGSEKKGWANIGEDGEYGDAKIENVNRNRSTIEVKISPTEGLKAETKAESTGGVDLRTVDNGIG